MLCRCYGTLLERMRHRVPTFAIQMVISLSTKTETTNESGASSEPTLVDDYKASTARGSEVVGRATGRKKQQISGAMKSYLQAVDRQQKTLDRHQAQFDEGKRHLANIVGVDPDSMTQADIDQAIAYLLPSGLSSPSARPMLKPPAEFFPHLGTAQFDNEGRPFDPRFFTLRPKFYTLLSEIALKTVSLNAHEDSQLQKNAQPEDDKKLILVSTKWMSQDTLADTFQEKVTEESYVQFLAAMDHLTSLPYAYLEKDFIFKYRTTVGDTSQDSKTQSMAFIPQVKVDEETGRRYAHCSGTKKRTKSFVTMYELGTGRITIDGRNFDDFRSLLAREVLLAPFLLIDRLGQFDVEAVTESKEDRSGAMVVPLATRHAIALCLAAFVDDDDRRKLRLAGLLTRDPRRQERNKINQPGARKKRLWKRR